MHHPDLSDQDYETLAAFRHALRRFAAFSESEAKARGLTPQQHQVLLAIKGTPGRPALSVGEIAAHLLVRHNSAVELIDRLADAGLVMRAPDPQDRRRMLVTLTGQAEHLLVALSGRRCCRCCAGFNLPPAGLRIRPRAAKRLSWPGADPTGTTHVRLLRRRTSSAGRPCR